MGRRAVTPERVAARDPPQRGPAPGRVAVWGYRSELGGEAIHKDLLRRLAFIICLLLILTLRHPFFAEAITRNIDSL